MPSLKAHFDGRSIVLDEPATLAVGQAVRVLIEPTSDEKSVSQEFFEETAAIKFKQRFSSHADSADTLIHREGFDERDALHIDPLEAVPADFVRRPGSGAGEIQMADDFDETPEEFKEYL